MSAGGVPVQSAVASPARVSRKSGRLFYALTSLIMLALMVTGFQHFYFQGRAFPGRDIPPPIRVLVTVHGVCMTLWMLVYVGQTALIATKRIRVHMFVGRLAALLAAGIVLSGLPTAVQATRIAPPEFVLWSMSRTGFLAVPFFGILLFGAMIAIGVVYRKRPEVHRPMMLFGTLSALAAAVARIPAISDLYIGTVWEQIFGPFLGTLVIGLVFVIARLLQVRSFDKWFISSYVLVLVVFLLTVQIAKTGAWNSFASLLVD